ncbi:hypothetical protein CPB83DRAFT_922596, partial [Crepidotus variabilis]
SNCGATHTPFWRRGLNDELNRNACGLNYKLTVDVVGRSRRHSFTQKKWPVFTENQVVRPSVAAQCYNCHTMATPLWRKDDEAKTVCNA